MRLAFAGALSIICGAVAATSGAAAADPARIGLELNRLEPLEAGRQIWLVAEPGAQDLAALALDMVLFDRDGLILDRLAVDLGPLAAGRTHVRAFPVEGIACDALGRALVNDVLICDAPAGPLDRCRDRIDARARGPVGLVN